MYGSQAAPRDFNLNGKEDSDLNHYQQQQQQQQMGGPGLLRFRSAPSSLLGEMCEDFLPHRSSTTESETVFTGFAPPELRDQVGGGAGADAGAGQRRARFVPDMERSASATAAHRQNGELSPTAASQMVYHVQQQQHLPSHGSTAVAAAAPVAMEGSYRVASSAAMDGEDQKSTVKSSNLVRHSSSPAGLFSHLSVENGYAVMGGMGGGGGFRVGTCSSGEASMVDGRLRGQLSFSSRQTSSSGLMSQISEIGGEGMGGGSSPEEGSLENGRCFMPGFPAASWDDPSLLSESFSGMKRARDPSEAQIGDVRCHAPTLTHHYSLPKNSSEMAAILQFQEAVPCKIRAKRGCATHPRSIAERVRRTRISERMRKLQELVPNMDKQTNTADMLDLAVDYIKDLERQVKSLAESRASCTCSSKQEP